MISVVRHGLIDLNEVRDEISEESYMLVEYLLHDALRVTDDNISIAVTLQHALMKAFATISNHETLACLQRPLLSQMSRSYAFR